MDVNRRWMYKGTYVLDESAAFVFRKENNGGYSMFLNTYAILNIRSSHNKITPMNYHFLQLTEAFRLTGPYSLRAQFLS